MSNNNDEIIKSHYAEEALKLGISPNSTIHDDITRQKEIELIKNFFLLLGDKTKYQNLKVLDLGCGNGHTLSVLSGAFPNNNYHGLEFTEEMLSIAISRNLDNCNFTLGDARSIALEDEYFDVVYTERCLINLLTWQEQKDALMEIHRILKPGGYYLMIECFTDGLENNNNARKEFGLDEIKQAHHNKYFDKELLINSIDEFFSIIQSNELSKNGEDLFQTNFLSSHYFIARVMHAALSKGELVRNSEFVKFFSFLPPIGNYSPIQAYLLKKK